MAHSSQLWPMKALLSGALMMLKRHSMRDQTTWCAALSLLMTFHRARESSVALWLWSESRRKSLKRNTRRKTPKVVKSRLGRQRKVVKKVRLLTRRSYTRAKRSRNVRRCRRMRGRFYRCRSLFRAKTEQYHTLLQSFGEVTRLEQVSSQFN